MIDEKKLIEELGKQIFYAELYGDGWDGQTVNVLCFGDVIDAIEQQPKVGEWIPADEPPQNDNYTLLSFDNFSGLLIGRYDTDEEGNGAYYLGDCCEEDTCVSNDMFVNAWQPLPKLCNPGTVRKYTNGDRIRAMSDEELTKIILCPYDTAGKPIDIMPCVKDGNIQELVPPEDCKQCMLKWLQKEVEE